MSGLPRWVEAPLAFFALVALAPVLAVLALAVRLTSPGPALFRQERIGRGGRPFTLLKFRSMTGAGAGSRVTAGGDARVTPLGRLLRATKLDELPELLHVVRGEMSLVGPRPEVPVFVDLEDTRWQRILEARPGLTDPVTLRLRGEEKLLEELGRLEDAPRDPEERYRRLVQPWKLRGYLRYLEERSAWGDVLVVLQTLRAVVDPSSAGPPSVEELRRVATENDAERTPRDA